VKNKLEYLAEALAEFGLSTASQVPATAYGAYKGATTPGGLSTRLKAFQKSAEDLTYQPRGEAAQDVYGAIAENTPEFLAEGLQRYGEWSAENPTLAIAGEALLGTVGGGAGNALKREIFRGPKDDLERALGAKAKVRMDQGEDPAQVWQDSGWGVHPKTGQFVTEIDDSGAKMVARPGTKNPMQLEQVIEHPELFKVTPDARLVDTLSQVERGGSFSPRRDMISIGKDMKPTDFMDSMVHELDHRTAMKFGLPKGGNPDQFGYKVHSGAQGAAAKRLSAHLKALKDEDLITQEERVKIAAAMSANPESSTAPKNYQDIMDMLPKGVSSEGRTRIHSALKDFTESRALKNQAYEKYRNISGEAMARLTTKRRNLTASERREDYPFDPRYFERLTGSRIEDLTDPPGGGGIQ
jgi:hypothetical protein